MLVYLTQVPLLLVGKIVAYIKQLLLLVIEI